MGFFDDVIGVVTNVLPKPVRRLAAPAIKLTTAVTKLQPKSLFELASKGPVLGPINFTTQTLAPKYAPVVGLASNVATALAPGGSVKMGLNIGGILNTVGQAFGGNQNPYFQGISNVANIASQFVPQPVMQTAMAVRPPMATAPAVAGAMRAVPMIGRKFFEKFPNLATSIQALRNRGANVTRAKLFSLLKRFGPDILITGGILTAAAVSELMMAGPGHRRMNPGNAKALRRSLRRLESFHKLCVRADKFRSPGRRRAPCKTSGTQFVRQG